MRTALAVIFIVIIVMALAGCGEEKKEKRLAELFNGVVTNQSPKKITFRFEMGTWGNKAIWIFEDIEWVSTNKVVGRPSETYTAQ